MTNDLARRVLLKASPFEPPGIKCCISHDSIDNRPTFKGKLGFVSDIPKLTAFVPGMLDTESLAMAGEYSSKWPVVVSRELSRA